MSTEANEQQQQIVQTAEAETSAVEAEAPAVQAETGNTSVLATPPRPKKKLLPAIIGAVAAVILILAGAGIYAYNTPANRLARLLDLGERYLSELNYEQAAVAFHDALEIEPMCLPAYAGGIKAYTGLGDTSALQSFYQDAVDVMAAMEPEALNENIDLAVEIFVQANDVFADDVEKAVAVLEQGYEMTDKNEQVADSLVDGYESLADIYEEAEDYERELDIYDKILDVQPDNEDALHNRSRRLEEYLELLISTGELDRAEELIEKYRDVIDDVNFEEFANRIAALREQIAAREDLLRRVYELMAAEDYVAMTDIDGSDEARAVVAALDGMPGIYAPEGFSENYTGVAAGVYPFGESGYYFYYGDYVSGIREGHGVSFISSSTYYSFYDGPWQNDAPNGDGSVMSYYRQWELAEYGSYYIHTETGHFTNGLPDGVFTTTIIDSYSTGHTFSGTFTAENGIPLDVYDQYPQYHDYDELYAQHRDDIIIYDILEDVSGYTWNNRIWWSYISPGEKLGLAGFTN